MSINTTSKRLLRHLQAVMSLRQNGLVKGGTEACAIIGHGTRWYEPAQVRFFDDEPVRHKMQDLIVSFSTNLHIWICSSNV